CRPVPPASARPRPPWWARASRTPGSGAPRAGPGYRTRGRRRAGYGPPRSRALQQPARLREDPAQHRPRELAGERVLLARVITGQQRHAVDEPRGHAVAEARRGRGTRQAEPLPCTQVGLPADAAEAHDDAHAVEQAQLLQQVRLAVRDLVRQRL